MQTQQAKQTPHRFPGLQLMSPPPLTTSVQYLSNKCTATGLLVSDYEGIIGAKGLSICNSGTCNCVQ